MGLPEGYKACSAHALEQTKRGRCLHTGYIDAVRTIFSTECPRPPASSAQAVIKDEELA